MPQKLKVIIRKFAINVYNNQVNTFYLNLIDYSAINVRINVQSVNLFAMMKQNPIKSILPDKIKYTHSEVMWLLVK